jgi:hypothetical protein
MQLIANADAFFHDDYGILWKPPEGPMQSARPLATGRFVREQFSDD